MTTPSVVSYYQLLGVQHNADNAVISRAYRQKARECHPDRHPRASEEEKASWTEKTQKLVDARDCLLDPGKRKTYDIRCASMIFLDVNDPANFFRREADARRAEQVAAQERRREEERQRNAARQRESQERARRESEARQRREAEEREERIREQRERERRERERREQERLDRERERAEQERVRSQQEQRERVRREHQPSFDGDSPENWQNFFTVLNFLWRLQNQTSGRRQSTPNSSNTSTPSTPSSSSTRSTPSAPYTPFTEFSSSRSYASSNASTPSSNPFTSRSSTFSGASTANTTPEPSTPPPRFFNWGYTANSQRSYRNTNTYEYPDTFDRLPATSSRRRWSSEEFRALLQLRQDYPFDSWDLIASKLNYRFGNGRNGNATRLKHRTACI
ncbi:DnaJ subfamily C member 7 [Orbilia ellipsospora]|uniref:DnaJ subfamily C member 7 n=1 Tax=Orbilia ellipsospora TaxID=2528407 RepID=A0AAV9XGH4_9PEZI